MGLSGERKLQRLIKSNINSKLKRKQLKLMCAFKMKYDKEKLEGQQPVPAGIYKVLFVGFFPKQSKPNLAKGGATSLNLNAKVKILDHPEFETDRHVTAPLNENIPSFIQDMVHSFGLEMENQLSDDPSLPGTWEGEEGKPETYKYHGPLIAKTAEWELGIKDYNGKPTQTIKRFICAVPQCATKFPKIRHSTDMAKNG